MGRTLERLLQIPEPFDRASVRSTIADHDGVVGQQLDELRHVSSGGRANERLQQAAMLRWRSDEHAACIAHVMARALEQLSTSRLALVEQPRNLRMVELEDIVQQQHRAF